MKKPDRWWVPDVVDLHIYGGLSLLGVGVDVGLLGLALAGAVLLGLGLRMG